MLARENVINSSHVKAAFFYQLFILESKSVEKNVS